MALSSFPGLRYRWKTALRRSEIWVKVINEIEKQIVNLTPTPS